MYISDEVWSTVTVYFDRMRVERPGRGRPRINRRAVLSGIVGVLLDDMSWGDVSSRIFKVSGNTCWRQFREWVLEGVWGEIADMLVNAWIMCGEPQWAARLIKATSERIRKMRTRRDQRDQ
ncbi:transposase [Burkholderia ambifaria]|uniref:transposase n=1 Tax=Burkholderia cepacia complex TaxID=87882 RepID=UPI001B9D7837|nr:MULTISPECIES: transposase [Burkholderia cepacia complex]MBR8067773.1 transposase [Burkholderia ambifaria]MBR8278821.1 transposase [Burkholderia cenocepacia]